MKYENTIDNLVNDLQPVKTLRPELHRVALWASVSYLIVIAEILLTGDLRANWQAQLIENPRFLLEFAVGLAVSPMAAWMAIKISVPHESNLRDWRRWAGPVGFIALALFVMFSVASPALEPTMAGKRPLCVVETLLYGIIPAAILCVMVRRSAPMMPGWSGLLIGFAAFTPTAIAMHIACMYDPIHILKFHIAPAALMTTITWVIGMKIFKT